MRIGWLPKRLFDAFRSLLAGRPALGWRRLITYTLPVESGSSLRGAGWRLVGERGGGSWSRKGRPRVDRAPTGQKWLWETGDTT